MRHKEQVNMSNKINPLSIYEKSDTEKVIDESKYYSQNRMMADSQLQNIKNMRKMDGMSGSTSQSAYPSAMLRQDVMLNGKYPMTQAFGNRNPIEKFSGGINYGVDFATPLNTPVALPTGNWQVVEASGNGSMNRGYGNSVLAQNMETGERIRFSHLNRLNANPGQKLQGNSVVGYTGSTGNSTGPHIDIEYYKKGGKIANILESSYARELF